MGAGAKQMFAPSGTTAADPRFWEQKARGAADVAGGAGLFAGPLMLAGAEVAPVGAVLGLGLGAGAQAGTEDLGEKAGIPPGMRTLAGQMAGAWGGAVGGMAGEGLTG